MLSSNMAINIGHGWILFIAQSARIHFLFLLIDAILCGCHWTRCTTFTWSLFHLFWLIIEADVFSKFRFRRECIVQIQNGTVAIIRCLTTTGLIHYRIVHIGWTWTGIIRWPHVVLIRFVAHIRWRFDDGFDGWQHDFCEFEFVSFFY